MISTQDLVVEMAADERLKEKRAAHIYERVYRGASDGEFQEAVMAARNVLNHA